MKYKNEVIAKLQKTPEFLPTAVEKNQGICLIHGKSKRINSFNSLTRYQARLGNESK
jgi:hypothetical protein